MVKLDIKKDDPYLDILKRIQNSPYIVGYSDSYSSRIFLYKDESNKYLFDEVIRTKEGIILVIKNLFPTEVITQYGKWKCWGNGNGIPRRDREVNALLNLLEAKKYNCPYPCSYRKYEKQPCSHSCKHSNEEYFSVGKVNGKVLPDVVFYSEK